MGCWRSQRSLRQTLLSAKLSDAVHAPSKQTKPRISRFRRLRLTLLLFLAAITTALVEPHALHFLVKYGLISLARLHGHRLAIGEVEGSLFEPFVFRAVQDASLKAGVRFRMEVRRADASFSWRALLFQEGAFFTRLTMDGFEGDVVFEPGGGEPPLLPWPVFVSEQRRLQETTWLPVPACIDVWHAALSVRAGKAGDRAMLLQKVHFQVSESAPGEIAIGALTVQRGWFHKTFTELHGTTALQGNRLVVAGLNLGQGIWLKSVTADLRDSAQGGLQISFEVAAFGGAIRGELVNVSQEHRPDIEVAGTFSQISVAGLARFLEVRETAGGIIREGKFSFRGSPRALEKATVSTRFEATDFVWGNRRWNLLVLGATAIDGRVQIPELQLQQAHNALKLKGELAMVEGNPWWASAFNFEISGRINNLRELSSLFGPRFSDTSGAMAIDGSVRGENKTFSGQLIVTGSKLTYRGAPIDVFNAAIKLDGNEFQVVNFEMVHGEDFVRGKGVVTILGEQHYAGEIKIAVEDLAAYAPLLEKPISPTPLAGGLSLNWSGNGTLEANSGAFTAKLRKLHAIGPNSDLPILPIDAEVEGSYAPGGLSLSQCVLVNEGTRLEMSMTANQSTITLDPLKLARNGAVWMSGSAVLPVNLFRWWVAPGVDALVPDAPFKVALIAKGVQLDDVARLSGRPSSISGILSGKFNTDGTLRNLKMTGAGNLSKGRIPPSSLLPALDNIEADAELDGNVLRFSRFAARHSVGEFSGIGTVDFSKFDLPSLDATVHGNSVEMTAGTTWKGKAKVDLSIAGTREHANVIGTADILALDICPTPDFAPLISRGSTDSLGVPAPIFSLPPPLDGWSFDVTAATRAPLELPSPGASSQGRAEMRVRLTGTGKALASSGSVSFAGLPLKTEFASGTVDATAFFSGTSGDNRTGASLAARITGKTSGVAFSGYVAGTASKPAVTFISEPEMSETDLRTLFAHGFVPLPADAGDLHPDLGIFPCYKEPPSAPAAAGTSTAVAPPPAASSGTAAAPPSSKP